MRTNVNTKFYIAQIFCALIAIGFFGSQWGPWVSGGDWSADAFLYPVWVGSPYFISITAVHLLSLSNRGASIVIAVSVMCFAVGSIFLYVETVVRPDAMAGILFLVVPIFQVAAVVAAVVVAKVVSIIQLERSI